MRFFIISLIVALQLVTVVPVGAQTNSTIQAVVPDWGQGDRPVHIAGDQTRDYEQRYDARNPIEKIVAEATFRGLELLLFLLLFIIAYWVRAWYERWHLQQYHRVRRS